VPGNSRAQTYQLYWRIRLPREHLSIPRPVNPKSLLFIPQTYTSNSRSNHSGDKLSLRSSLPRPTLMKLTLFNSALRSQTFLFRLRSVKCKVEPSCPILTPFNLNLTQTTSDLFSHPSFQPPNRSYTSMQPYFAPPLDRKCSYMGHQFAGPPSVGKVEKNPAQIRNQTCVNSIN